MKWIRREYFTNHFYYESTDYKFQIWKRKKYWVLMQAQPYYSCEMYIDDVYRDIGKFHSLKQAKTFADWYTKWGE